MNTTADLDPGQRLLVRVDLNSPVEDGRIQDNARFERHAETVTELLGANHAVALMAHQGRPGREDFVTLEGHAAVLSDYLDQGVRYVPDLHGAAAMRALEDLDRGEVYLLENVRMDDEELPEKSPEEHADSAFVRDLAPEFNAYVNDAYSAAHRAHASIVGFPVVMDAYAGPVMATEYEYNTSVRERTFDGQVTMALGGTKAEDLIHVMERVEDTVDDFLLGGVVAELFLRAAGHDVGFDVGDTDLFDEQWEKNGDRVEALAERYGDRLHLPVDLAREGPAGERVEDRVADIEKTEPYLDVGAETVDAYLPYIEDAEAAFVKGALGVFEDERFADGTVSVLEAIADSEAFSVVGGGDTARAVEMYGLEEADFSHVSIAGGAYIRALAGDPLPAVEALERSAAGF